MKASRVLTLVSMLVAGLACAGGSLAQGDKPKATADVRASHLIGATIQNEPGWEFGGVDDLLVDLEENKVVFVVLNAGSRFEANEEDLALEVPDASFRYDGRRVVWDDDLRSLKRQWWRDSALENLEESRRKRLVSADEVIGAPLVDARGERVGQVDDLVVSLSEGVVRFAVVDYDLGWFKPGKAVALDRLQLVRQPDKTLAVRVDRARLEAAAPFEDRRWPGLSNSRMPLRLERLLSPG